MHEQSVWVSDTRNAAFQKKYQYRQSKASDFSCGNQRSGLGFVTGHGRSVEKLWQNMFSATLQWLTQVGDDVGSLFTILGCCDHPVCTKL